MDEGICSGCNQKYIIIAGHSCGDTGNTSIVRGTLAKEMMKSKALQEELTKVRSELNELQRYVTPIGKHFSGEYNKWRVKNPREISYTEAGTYIIKYLRGLVKNQE